MFILVIASGMPSKKNPLKGIFEHHQALVLSKEHDVVYLSVDLSSFHKFRHFGRRVFKHSESFSIIDWSMPTLGRFTPGIIFGMLSNVILSIEIKKLNKKPDIIHFHFGKFASGFLKSLSSIRTIKVLTEHDTNVHKFKDSKGFVDKLMSTYRQFDQIIVVSDPLKTILEKIYRVTNCIAVPNMFSPLFSISEPNENVDFRFICVSSIDERKNIETLMKAFIEEFDFSESITLTVIGDGPLKSQLQEKYDSISIQFLGSLSREDVANEMKNANVFVLPSLIETFGVVYIEAMACGLPVIANKSGGPESFITNDNGILLKNHSVEELRSALRFIQLNYEKYDKQKISDYANKNFSEEAVSTKLIKLYQKLISEDK